MGQAGFPKQASHSSDCAKLFTEGKVRGTDLVSNLCHLLGPVPMQSKREHNVSVQKSNSQTPVLEDSVWRTGERFISDSSGQASHGIPVLILTTLNASISL